VAKGVTTAMLGNLDSPYSLLYSTLYRLFIWRVGQHSLAIFFAFAISYRNLTVLKVQIFHPQAQSFHQAHTTAIEQANNKMIDAI
jgi:hypothetical protein